MLQAREFDCAKVSSYLSQSWQDLASDTYLVDGQSATEVDAPPSSAAIVLVTLESCGIAVVRLIMNTGNTSLQKLAVEVLAISVYDKGYTPRGEPDG